MREWKPVITSARSCCRCSNRAPCSSCRGTRLRRAAQQPPGAVLRTRNAASYLGSCYRGINRIQNRVTPSIAVMSPHFADDVIALFVAAAEARGCVGLRSGPRGRSCGHATQPRASAAAAKEKASVRIQQSATPMARHPAAGELRHDHALRHQPIAIARHHPSRLLGHQHHL